MTSALTPEYEEYPQYCYHLSPTITKWCPLEASHIAKLRWHPGFEGQDDTFFHLNHPIRWVRVVGLVVAIDSFYARRVYTVDDSTGVCIECTISISPPAPADGEKADKDAEQAAEQAALDPYADIDVGMVVDVKGNLSLFRDEKQIKIQKMQQVKSTNQEVEFWNKIKSFRSDILGKPWVLEKKVLRRLEKENRTDARGREKESQRKKMKAESSRQESKEHRQHRSHASATTIQKKSYKPSKLSSVTAAEDGQYDALGL
ncbi:hypothetical protein PFICI_10073 [Pestalotiopsis fici W106-1]|uniref:CST complex subunit STN1 n=1 Tax=Pestalotiopsis fici (strain W106-1 / CGMCC3.15140) TaxID=1229662 RepID=W3WYN8_PESFW|nr:uncharacterized protein PFICI_10073 [Pestalotiopsis fici W106-1]ETS78011.1 hypothetical protein PFICI_10073 [Pestalotiopsis fici W106-1]